jgi:hypothetical protein
MTSKISIPLTKLSKSSIDLVEKPFDSKLSGEWIGKETFQHIFLGTYIQEKFKDKLYFLPSISISIFYSESEDDVVFEIYDKGADNQYLKSPRSIKPYIEKFRDTKKRFTFFSITKHSYSYEKRMFIGHALSGLYDKKINKVEIFDSIGSNLKPFKKSFKDFFVKIYGNNVKIVYLVDRCIAFGKLLSKCDDWDYKYRSEGFCVIWVLWFLELRVSNPDIPKEKLIEKALERLKKGDKVCKFVRGYAQFVDNIVSKYIIVRTCKNLVIKPKESSFAEKDYKFLYVLLASLVGGFAAFGILNKLKKL